MLVLEAIHAAFVLLSPPETASAFAGFGGVPAFHGEDLLDEETIASIKELRSPGEPDPLEELIALFNEDTPARIAEIQQAFAASDIQRLEAAAHALKGSAGNLGARPLVQICTAIMEQARSGKLPPAELVAKLEPSCEAVKAALEKAKN